MSEGRSAMNDAAGRRARSRCRRAHAGAQEMVDPRAGDRGRGADLRRRQSDHAEVQIRSAHHHRGARERVLPAGGREGRDRTRPHGRPGGDHQPCAACALARCRKTSDQGAEARRAAGIRLRAARRVAHSLFARLPRARERPAEHDAGRARARSLLRAPDRLPGRQVARDLDRIPVVRSGIRRQGREHDRGQLPRAAAVGAARPDPRGRQMALRRDRRAAHEGGRGRGEGRGLPLQDQSLRRHQQHVAVEPDARRIQPRPRGGALAEGRSRGQGEIHPRHAQERRRGRILRHGQFAS